MLRAWVGWEVNLNSKLWIRKYYPVALKKCTQKIGIICFGMDGGIRVAFAFLGVCLPALLSF